MNREEPATGTEPEPRPQSKEWRRRRSTRGARRILTATYLGLWAMWSAMVYIWAGSHGHADWQAGNKPVFLLVAAATFWPLAVAHWWLTYPGDPRDMPWSHADDE